MDLADASPVAPRIGRPAQAPPPTTDKPFSVLGFQPFGDDGPTFHDMLDIVNPLQHLPLISYVYRELTGDTIDPLPRVVGGAIFGGLYGAVGSLANVIFEQVTGDDVGGTAIALVKNVIGGDEEPDSAPAKLADASPTENTPPAGGAPYRDVLAWAEGEAVWQDAMLAARMMSPADGSEGLGVASHRRDLDIHRTTQLGLLSPKVAGVHSVLDIVA